VFRRYAKLLCFPDFLIFVGLRYCQLPLSAIAKRGMWYDDSVGPYPPPANFKILYSSIFGVVLYRIGWWEVAGC